MPNSNLFFKISSRYITYSEIYYRKGYHSNDSDDARDGHLFIKGCLFYTAAPPVLLCSVTNGITALNSKLQEKADTCAGEHSYLTYSSGNSTELYAFMRFLSLSTKPNTSLKPLWLEYTTIGMFPRTEYSCFFRCYLISAQRLIPSTMERLC